MFILPRPQELKISEKLYRMKNIFKINFPDTEGFEKIAEEQRKKEEILKKLSLVNRNNELLNAGYILFAKEAKLEMQMAIFATETKLTFLDIIQYLISKTN